MKRRNDTKMYKLHKKCFNCVVEMEHKLKIEGKYEEYERNVVANNAKDYVNHLESYLMEALNTSNSQYVSERGEVENWKGGLNIEKTTKEIKESIKTFKDSIEEYKNNNKT